MTEAHSEPLSASPSLTPEQLRAYWTSIDPPIRPDSDPDAHLATAGPPSSEALAALDPIIYRSPLVKNSDMTPEDIASLPMDWQRYIIYGLYQRKARKEAAVKRKAERRAQAVRQHEQRRKEQRDKQIAKKKSKQSKHTGKAARASKPTLDAVKEDDEEEEDTEEGEVEEGEDAEVAYGTDAEAAANEVHERHNCPHKENDDAPNEETKDRAAVVAAAAVPLPNEAGLDGN